MMFHLLEKRTWQRPYAGWSWGSMIVALFSSVVFFAGYGGPEWWVEYYPRPDGPFVTGQVSFGLWRLCMRGYCVYDMTYKNLIPIFAPADVIKPAVYNLPACQWIITFVVPCIGLLFVFYLMFLSGRQTYYAEVWTQILIVILIVIPVAIFGGKFRGTKPYLPFGWSYWLTVVAAILFYVNSILMLCISVAVRRRENMAALIINNELERKLAL